MIEKLEKYWEKAQTEKTSLIEVKKENVSAIRSEYALLDGEIDVLTDHDKKIKSEISQLKKSIKTTIDEGHKETLKARQKELEAQKKETAEKIESFTRDKENKWSQLNQEDKELRGMEHELMCLERHFPQLITLLKENKEQRNQYQIWEEIKEKINSEFEKQDIQVQFDYSVGSNQIYIVKITFTKHKSTVILETIYNDFVLHANGEEGHLILNTIVSECVEDEEYSFESSNGRQLFFVDHPFDEMSRIHPYMRMPRYEKKLRGFTIALSKNEKVYIGGNEKNKFETFSNVKITHKLPKRLVAEIQKSKKM